MGRKSSKQYSWVFLVKGERFKLRNLPLMTSFLLCSAVNSVGTSLEFLQHLAAVPTPNIAGLVHFVFPIHNDGFCGGPNTFYHFDESVFKN